jgi:predicted Fe-Mo cluster-binding NifX family protein
MTQIALLVAISFLSVQPIYMEQDGQAEKIAIASEGKTMDSSASDRAARCKYFLIFGLEGNLVEVIENPHRDALFDAGPATVDLLAGKDVRLLVANRIGTRMMEALQKKKITRIKFTGTVEDALELALEKK